MSGFCFVQFDTCVSYSSLQLSAGATSNSTARSQSPFPDTTLGPEADLGLRLVDSKSSISIIMLQNIWQMQKFDGCMVVLNRSGSAVRTR